jgi:hypothetical protein
MCSVDLPPVPAIHVPVQVLTKICHPKENNMQKTFLFCLLFSAFSSFARIHPLPLSGISNQLAIPVDYTITNKGKVLYVPNACSGMINDAVAGEGEMTVSVMGKILNGQLSVQVKVDYKGSAVTTVEGLLFQVKGSLAVAETKAMFSEPVDIFIKGSVKLEGKNQSSCLFISDIGYITVYPDGSVANHILDPRNPPDYSHPKVYCTEPKE